MIEISLCLLWPAAVFFVLTRFLSERVSFLSLVGGDVLGGLFSYCFVAHWPIILLKGLFVFVLGTPIIGTLGVVVVFHGTHSMRWMAALILGLLLCFWPIAWILLAANFPNI